MDVLCCRELALDVWVLRSDYSVQCYNHEHRVHQVFAIIFIVLALVIPSVIIWTFWSASQSEQKGKTFSTSQLFDRGPVRWMRVEQHGPAAVSITQHDIARRVDAETASIERFLATRVSARCPDCL